MAVDKSDQSALTPNSARTPPPAASDPRLKRPSRPSVNTPHPSNSSQGVPPTPTSRTSLLVSQESQSPTNLRTSNGTSSWVEVPADAPICDLSHILPQLIQVMDSRAAIVWKKDERARIEMEDKGNRWHLEKAKALPAFPATVELYQSRREGTQNELRKLDSELRKHATICHDIAEDLRNMLRVKPSPSESERATKLAAEGKEKLEAELREKLEADLKDRLESQLKKKLEADLKESLEVELRNRVEADTKENNRSLSPKDRISSDFLTTIKKVQSSVSSQSKSNSVFGSKIHALEQWKKEVEDGQAKLLPQSAPGTSDSMRPDINEVLERADEAIRKVQGEMSTMRTELETFKADNGSRQKSPHAGQIADVAIRLSKVEQHLLEWQNMENQTRENVNALRILRAEHDAVHGAHRKQTDQLQREVGQVKSETATFSDKITNLESRAEALSDSKMAELNKTVQTVESQQRTSREQLGKLLIQAPALIDTSDKLQNCLKDTQALSQRMGKCETLSETLHIGVRSLETRYNNINTEDLVRRMAHAMHEMYPSMQSLLNQLEFFKEQLNSLRDQFTKEIESLKTATHNADPTSITSALEQVQDTSKQFSVLQNTQIAQAEDIVRNLEEIKDLSHRFERHSDALEELGEKFSDATELSEQVLALGPRLDDVETRLQSQASESGAIKQRFEEFRTKLEELQEIASAESMTRTCEQGQRQRDQGLAIQIQESKLPGSQQTNTESQEHRQKPHRLTYGPHPGPERVDSGSTPSPQVEQDGTSRDLPDAAQVPLAPRVMSMSISSGAARQAPRESRAIPRSISSADVPQAPAAARSVAKPISSGITAGPSNSSLRIGGAAAQQENETARATSSMPRGSLDQSMDSTVTANPPPLPAKSIRAGRDAATRDLPITGRFSAQASSPANPPGQAPAKSKKRRREETISVNGRRTDSTPPHVARSSPAPSSSSDQLVSKKAKKRAKRQSQLK